MTVHVIGAGIAGLAAALRMAQSGLTVRLYEATGQAGGRCRSLNDPALGVTVDTGIHLITGDFDDFRAFLAAAEAPPLRPLPSEICGFVDCADGRQWRLVPGAGRVPWWLLDPRRWTPGTGLADLITMIRIAVAGPATGLADLRPPHGLAHRRFWQPFCVAALNTSPAEAAAGMLRPFLDMVLFGTAQRRALSVAAAGLTESFIAPALDRLAALGVVPAYRQTLRELAIVSGRIVGLRFTDGQVPLGRDDMVVLAVPPRIASRMVPGMERLPESPIVAAHFLLPRAVPRRFAILIAEDPVWLLVEDRMAVATMGAAEHLMRVPKRELAERIWRAIARALDMPVALPPARVMKVRDGTYLHSPSSELAKPTADAGLANLRLAGDWTLPGLAANIDTAARSGHIAADSIIARQADCTRRSGVS